MTELKELDKIGDLKKDASTLAFANMMGDFYHNNIKNSAKYFVNHNAGGLYYYVAQFASGTTLWESQVTGKRVMIDSDGKLVN